MVRAGVIRKIKATRSYTYEEMALVTGKSTATVRSWVKDGLPALRSAKPHLIVGSNARSYLTKRFHATKPKMQLNEVRCFTCRARTVLESDLSEIVPNTPAGWRLQGICSRCGGLCSKVIATRDIPKIQQELAVETLGGIQA